jgi:hypothetical protein
MLSSDLALIGVVIYCISTTKSISCATLAEAEEAAFTMARRHIKQHQQQQQQSRPAAAAVAVAGTTHGDGRGRRQRAWCASSSLSPSTATRRRRNAIDILYSCRSSFSSSANAAAGVSGHSWYDDNDTSFCVHAGRRRRTIVHYSQPRAHVGHKRRGRPVTMPNHSSGLTASRTERGRFGVDGEH